ncbi:hypothetical protein HaLaN_02685, partial [Haematococcus lacustris]
MALASLFSMPSHTLASIMQDVHGWMALCLLVADVLAGCENEKMVSLGGGGSATTSQARAVAELQSGLAGFVSRCLHAFPPPVPLNGTGAQDFAGEVADRRAEFLAGLLDTVLNPAHLASHLLPLLSHLSFLQPSSQAASAKAAVLQLAALTLDPGTSEA